MTKAADLANKLANLFTNALGLTTGEKTQARTNIDAQVALGFTPLNKAGDSATGVILTPNNPALFRAVSADQSVGNGANRLIFANDRGTVGFTISDGGARFTAQVAGRYKVVAIMETKDGTANQGNAGVQIKRNGTFFNDNFIAKTTSFQQVSTQGIFSLAVNDYVEIFAVLENMAGLPIVNSRTSVILELI